MAFGLSQLTTEWRNYRAFTALPKERRKIVFYSEGPGYWVHFEPIIRHLYEDHGQDIVYLTSDKADPVLDRPPAGVKSYYIGDSTIRTLLFAGLRANVMVMTMPDLQTYNIKRSPHGVHYVYVHHSMVSCHMAYRPEAFDHFDTVFCVGPHHIREIRTREAYAGLKAKFLVEHGYGRLESLMTELKQEAAVGRSDDNGHHRILIAPSWGDSALLERHGGGFMEPLLAEGYRVTLRPHPQTRRFHAAKLDAIISRYRMRDNFTIDEDMASKRSLVEADLMVSDWSGVALEFAFALERPILFVDVPHKINNPDYLSINIEPMESRIREKIGRVISEDRIMFMAQDIRRLLEAREITGENIAAIRGQSIFNLGNSGKVGANALIDIVNSPNRN